MKKFRSNECTRKDFEELIILAQEDGNTTLIKEVMTEDWQEIKVGLKADKEARPIPPKKVLKWMRVAASVAFLIVFGYTVFHWISPDSKEFVTGNGEVQNFELPDGSSVKLNANSKLTWLEKGLLDQDRNVELTGEAFFNIVKNKNSRNELIPFKVHTKDLTINVLGTSFNVSSREKFSEVYLYEGKVELEIGESGVKMMKPGDRIGYDHGEKKIFEKDSESISSSASWVNGVLNFHNRTFGYVLRNLSDIYGKEIRCDDEELIGRRINLGVPYMEWESTRKALEMSMEIEIIQVNNEFLVNSKGSRSK